MNTYEKVVDYLKLHKKLDYDIEFYRNKMGGLKAISYSQEEKGTSADDMMTVYMQKIESAENKQKEIEKFIEDNFNEIDRLVIHDRYVNNMTLKAIGNGIGYTASHVKKIIDKSIYKYLAR